MAYFSTGAYAVAAMLAAAGISAYSAVQQGQTNKKVGEYNAKMNEFAALDAQKKGDQDANKIRMRMESMKGSARTRMAAAGLDLSDGTAADIQDTTDFFGESDMNTARYNGRKDAAAARSAGSLARWQGSNSADQGNLQALGSLLGGASSAYEVNSKWYPKTAPPG